LATDTESIKISEDPRGISLGHFLEIQNILVDGVFGEGMGVAIGDGQAEVAGELLDPFGGDSLRALFSLTFCSVFCIFYPPLGKFYWDLTLAICHPKGGIFL